MPNRLVPWSRRASEDRIRDADQCARRLREKLKDCRDVPAIFRIAARELSNHIPFETFAGLLVQPGNNLPKVMFAEGYHAQDAETLFGPSGIGPALQAGRTVRVGNVQNSNLTWNTAVMTTPLRAHDQLLGVLHFGHKSADFFEKHDEEFMTRVGDAIADGLQHVLLRMNLEQRSGADLIIEAIPQLSSAGMHKMFEELTGLLKTIINFSHLTVWRFDGHPALKPVFCWPALGEPNRQLPLPLAACIVGDVARLKRSANVPSVHVDRRYLPNVHSPETNSLLAVPIVHKTDLIAVLSLESKQTAAFDDFHRETLEEIASMLGAKIRDAAVFETNSLEQRRVNSELQRGLLAQQRLLAESTDNLSALGLEIAAYSVAARLLSGDFYFSSQVGGKAVIGVADVAGKGPDAALRAQQVLGSIRELIRSNSGNSTEALSALNRALSDPRTDGVSIAASLCVYDTKSMELSLTNAGLPRPLLLRNGAIEKLDVKGTPLGLLPEPALETQTYALQVGDILVFVSDGVLDCTDSRGIPFGYEGIRRLMKSIDPASAQQMADAIMGATQTFSESTDPAIVDDRTVLVVRVTTQLRAVA